MSKKSIKEMMSDLASELKETLQDDPTIQALTPEYLGIVTSYEKTISADYKHRSYDTIKDFAVNRFQYTTPRTRLLRLMELQEKAYFAVLELVDDINGSEQVIKKADKKESGSLFKTRYEVITKLRTLNDTIHELQSIQTLIKDQLRELSISSLEDVNWEEIIDESMVDQGETISKAMSASGGHLDPQQFNVNDMICLEKYKNSGRSKIIVPLNQDEPKIKLGK